MALKRLPEVALQYPASGFPDLRLEPNIHLEAIQGRTIRRKSLQVKPGASSFRRADVPSRTICRWGKMIGWLGLTEGELRGQSRGVRSGSAGSPDCEETMNIGFVWAGPTGQKPHLRSCENASYVETKLASFGHFSMGTARPREGPRTVRTSRCKVGQAEGADPPE